MPPGYNSSEQEDSNASLRYSFLDELTYSGGGIARIFRLVPDEPVLVPLIESFALACLQIPNLENATLATELSETIDIDGETNDFTSEWGYIFCRTSQSIQLVLRPCGTRLFGGRTCGSKIDIQHEELAARRGSLQAAEGNWWVWGKIR